MKPPFILHHAIAAGLLLAATISPAAILVTNEAGEPIPDARVLAILRDGMMTANKTLVADENGRANPAVLPPYMFADSPANVTLVATAPGHAWATVELKNVARAKDVEASIAVPRGREVTVRLVAPEGRPLPEGTVPFLFDKDTMGPIWWARGDVTRKEEKPPEPRRGLLGMIGDAMTRNASEARLQSLSTPEAKGDGTFVFRLPEEPHNAAYIGINDPEYLLNWVPAGGLYFNTTEATYDLPLPGSVAIKAAYPEGGTTTPLTIELSGSIILANDQGNATYRLAHFEGKGPEGLEARMDNLAPGRDLMAQVYYGTQETRLRLPPQDQHYEQEPVSVKSNEVVEIAKTFRRFDLDTLRGDATAIVALTRTDGSPAAGVAWELLARTESVWRSMPLGAGKADENGIARIEGLKAGLPASTYSLKMRGGEPIGNVVIEAGAATAELTMTVPPAVGDIAPDVALVNMDTSETVRLSDYRGQVLFLDFWATWCGPCQEPMQKNSDLLKRRAHDWAGKAAILAISCDDEIGTLKQHIGDREWGNITNLWCEEGGSGWNATAMRAYGIGGVPTAFLVDPEGKILWRGHPSNFNLEQRIDAMIRDAGRRVSMGK